MYIAMFINVYNMYFRKGNLVILKSFGGMLTNHPKFVDNVTSVGYSVPLPA